MNTKVLSIWSKLVTKGRDARKPDDISHPAKRRILGTDRRCPEDRRRSYNLDYFSGGGKERRSAEERRHQLVERRSDWVRVSAWTSAMVGLGGEPDYKEKVYDLTDERGNSGKLSSSR